MRFPFLVVLRFKNEQKHAKTGQKWPKMTVFAVFGLFLT